MINKKITYNVLVALTGLISFSCAQQEMPDGDYMESEDYSGITFSISLPDAKTRSIATTYAGDFNAGFYVSAICPEDEVTGSLNPYIDGRKATQLDENGYFGILDESGDPCKWPTMRHGKEGKLKFFAFYPACEEMRQSAGVDSEKYFALENKSTKNASKKVTYDYRLNQFKVNKEIPRHIDFVTATAEGSRKDNGESGMRLDFEHQLSRLTLKAWGNTVNDIEIAGVRIGCAVTESDFNFAAKPTNLAQGDATVSGNWVEPQQRGCVEYIFREGDIVVNLAKGDYSSETKAASIMGNGGSAMVIPADNPVWKHTTDASNTNKGLYFSVLLRVKENDENKTLLYPYIDGAELSATVTTDEMSVIYFSVERATGKIIKRLYKQKGVGYFIDPEFTTPYNVPATEEIRNYGWAAIPLSTTLRWKPGYHYTYKLNYSAGVGVHDPADPFPGKPIISSILVGVTEAGETWPTVSDFTTGGEANVTDKITIQ